MTQRKIFIWVGHPRAGSFCEALADSYRARAEAAGADVRQMNLSRMTFDTADFTGFGGGNALEEDLVAWQQGITWADHLLFVYPYWWGAMPGRAKAVLDKALQPGFGFKYREKGMGWDKLLTGKTADALITSDTPPWYDTLVYRKPGRRVIRNQVLGFCGVKPRHIKQFGPVRTASDTQRNKWIATAGRMGETAAA